MSDHQWESRWCVGEARSLEGVEPGPPDRDGERWFSFTDGKIVGYTVSDAFGNTDYEVNFGPKYKRKAELLAEEFNRYEWQGPLDPAFAERRNRLKRLAPRFGYMAVGPQAARWPVCPGRYLVEDWGVGWHPEDSYILADDLDTVREMVGADEANVGRVIDLDTGQDVPFERTVSVEIGVGA